MRVGSKFGGHLILRRHDEGLIGQTIGVLRLEYHFEWYICNVFFMIRIGVLRGACMPAIKLLVDGRAC